MLTHCEILKTIKTWLIKIVRKIKVVRRIQEKTSNKWKIFFKFFLSSYQTPIFFALNSNGKIMFYHFNDNRKISTECHLDMNIIDFIWDADSLCDVAWSFMMIWNRLRNHYVGKKKLRGQLLCLGWTICDKNGKEQKTV